MTNRYVGPGGNDGNSGLTWELRKLTLNGVEDTPVVAGDTIYIGPGTYREELVCDVNGSSGNPITYVGDIFGLNTDGIGGLIRVTGSNNDTTVSRGKGIWNHVRTYRTFKNIRIDMCSEFAIGTQLGFDNLVIEDCICVADRLTVSSSGVWLSPWTSNNNISIKRSVIVGNRAGLQVWGDIKSMPGTIENCIFVANSGDALSNNECWDTVYKNCTFYGSETKDTSEELIKVSQMGGNDIKLYNNVYLFGRVTADTVTDIVEDYGFYVPRTTDAAMRSNVTKGANSVTRNLMEMPPFLFDGFYLPHNTFDYMQGSPIKDYGCGQSPPSDDFYGLPRPTSDAKKTRGAIQYNVVERETTIVPDNETESIKMPDAMVHQIFIPITGDSMEFSVRVNREGDYAGTNPQMTIKQPGQSDRTQTDVGSAGVWNTLYDQFTPASSPSFVVLQIRSDNTAISGDYATYWGGFEVK